MLVPAVLFCSVSNTHTPRFPVPMVFVMEKVDYTAYNIWLKDPNESKIQFSVCKTSAFPPLLLD